MNICFCGMVFNGDHFLRQAINSVKPYGTVVFAEGPVRFWRKRGYITSLDDTNRILSETIGGDNVVHGQFEEKDDEARATELLIPKDTDFAWWVDADEIWSANVLERVIALLETDQYDSMSFKATSFYGGFERVMTGFEREFEVHRIQRWYPGATWASHRPPTVNAPDGRPWREHRHLNHHQTEEMGLTYFHYSYVFPSQMQAKAEYYHARGGTIEDYYQRVYLRWVLGNELTRRLVENEFNGVHDWLPERRGDCYTVPFTGQHPPEISKSMPELLARFERELAEYR